MKVLVHLYKQSKAMAIDNASNAYQKGDLYCVSVKIDEKRREVHKFPIQHIFKIIEVDPPEVDTEDDKK